MSGGDTKRRYAEAASRLAAAQKPGDGVPAYLRWVNRGLGRRAAAAAYSFGWSPTQVTLLSGASSLAALVVIALGTGSWAVALSGSLLLLIGYALDSADGQLARLTQASTAAGEWLDHLVDAFRLPGVHLAIAVHVARVWNSPSWLVGVALAYMLVSSVWFFGQILAEKMLDSPNEQPGAGSAIWVSFMKLPYDVGTLYLVVALLPLTAVFATGYTAIFVITLCIAVPSLSRKYRALGRQAGDSTSSRAP